MIRVRVFNKKELKEESKYFVNEWSAMKFIKKTRKSGVYQVIGNTEYVKGGVINNENNKGKDQ